MDIINLTPHDINIISDNTIRTITKSGKIARIDSRSVLLMHVDNIPVNKTVFGDIIDLPDPKPDTIYLVSAMVLDKVVNRSDVFSPDTGPDSVVRNDSGNIIGVKFLRTV